MELGVDDADGCSSDAALTNTPQHVILPELITAVLTRLPHNEVALSARRTCRAAAQHFAEEHHRTAAMGQPLPPHAAGEPLEDNAVTAFRNLAFHRKLGTLSVAAASGSVANLELAWQLLQPCLFPELLTTDFYYRRLYKEPYTFLDDPGFAAMQSGNVSALAWLLERCPGLVNGRSALQAAGWYCSLSQLQEAWALLLGGVGDTLPLLNSALQGAAGSPTADAIAKMEWLLQQGSCALTVEVAAEAARSGDLARLQWLQERGCPLGHGRVLAAALKHADLSVADWLVDQAGCAIPDPQSAAPGTSPSEAAAASGSVHKLCWLQARGLAVLPPSLDSAFQVMEAAAASGQLEVVQFLHRLGGARLLSRGVMCSAVSSGSVEVAAYLVGAGCPMHERLWFRAARAGEVAMIRWLLEEAHLPGHDMLLDELVHSWPETTAEDNRQLLAAVQLLAPLERDTGTNQSTLRLAASRDDVSLVRYLPKGLGWELDHALLFNAASGGSEAMLEWLVERGCAAGPAAGHDHCYLRAGGVGATSARLPACGDSECLGVRGCCERRSAGWWSRCS